MDAPATAGCTRSSFRALPASDFPTHTLRPTDISVPFLPASNVPTKRRLPRQSPNSALDPGAVGVKTPATKAAAEAVAEAARRKPGRSLTTDKREKSMFSSSCGTCSTCFGEGRARAWSGGVLFGGGFGTGAFLSFTDSFLHVAGPAQSCRV